MLCESHDLGVLCCAATASAPQILASAPWENEPNLPKKGGEAFAHISSFPFLQSFHLYAVLAFWRALMGLKWLKAIFFIAGLVLEGFETAGAELEHIQSFLLQADTSAQSPSLPHTAQLTAFMNGVKNNTRCEAVA